MDMASSYVALVQKHRPQQTRGIFVTPHGRHLGRGREIVPCAITCDRLYLFHTSSPPSETLPLVPTSAYIHS